MNARLVAVLRYALGLGLGAGLLALAFRNVSWAELQGLVAQVDPLWLAASLAVNLYSHWLRGWRWNLLLEASGQRVATSHAFAAVLFGYMVNYAVPRLGEVSRCTILLRSDRVPLLTSGGTVVTERVIDVLVLLVFVGVVFLLEFDRLVAVLAPLVGGSATESTSKLPLLLGLVGVGLAFGGALLLTRRRWMAHPLAVRLLAAAGELLRSATGVFRLRQPLRFGLLTVGIWAGYTLSSWLAMQALPATAGQNLYLAFVIMAMGGIGMAVPSPGGIGSFHWAITYTFVMFGLAQAAGNALALLIHTPQLLVVSLSGGLSYLYLVLRARQQAGPAPSDAS